MGQKSEVGSRRGKNAADAGFFVRATLRQFPFWPFTSPLAQRPVDTTPLLLDAHVAQELRCRLLKPYTVKAAAPTVSGTWKWPPK